ncbi:hypothetical protein SAY86_008249 [Trapa natans]|uniref:Protein BIC1 n=1 Tax=Trapa natans TaxID=22666 RepID=A0AAN7QAB8_TRANT|nr:hypothetical protein SAY86_008249 [Trapa natans]
MEGGMGASLERSSENVGPSMGGSQSRPVLEDLAEHREVLLQEEVSSTHDKLRLAAQQGCGGHESKLQQPPLQDCFREKLKRHRDEVAGRVTIPDSWGQEDHLTDWMEYSTFDALLGHTKISSAREALMADGRRAASQRPRIEISKC